MGEAGVSCKGIFFRFQSFVWVLFPAGEGPRVAQGPAPQGR